MEALTNADIIACEDTRKTGKMLELIFQKRMKESFKATFGADFDTFYDIDEEILKNQDFTKKQEKSPFEEPKTTTTADRDNVN